MNTDHRFELKPFESLPLPADLKITGQISRRQQRLNISYDLRDPLSKALLPPAAALPCRLDELWQSTCFELFLASPNQDPYWEFNLSPAGHWNVYRLEGYRRGLAAEPSYRQLSIQIRHDPTQFRLTLAAELPPGLEPDQPVQVAITAVIQLRTGPISYWALGHGGEEPDFHCRKGFLLNI